MSTPSSIEKKRLRQLRAQRFRSIHRLL